MKRFLLLASATLMLAASCVKTNTAKIEGTIADHTDSCLVLQYLDLNRLQPVDTIAIDEKGTFKADVALSDENPAFYYLFDGENQVAALILLPGDKVKLTVDRYGEYEVEGSEESSLLKTLDEAFYAARVDLENYADKMEMTSDDALAQEYAKSMSRRYVNYKKAVIKHMMEHPKSISSAILPFQKFNENLPVFNESTDILIIRQLCDSLKTVFPSAQLVTALEDEVNRRQSAFDLNQKLSQMEAINYPELSLPDINGQQQVLSALDGKVIVLAYWSVSQAESKMFNQELVEVYDRLHDAGLEIYQVSLDIDKAKWASTVKAQGLPWISVNDGLGTMSPACTKYNITYLPAMFVFDRKGDLVGKDVYDINVLESLIKKNL